MWLQFRSVERGQSKQFRLELFERLDDVGGVAGHQRIHSRIRNHYYLHSGRAGCCNSIGRVFEHQTLNSVMKGTNFLN